MIAPRYDVAVVGGGHNGLVSACYLAKAGLSVLVLERNAEPGGATRSLQLFDGVEAKLSAYSYLVSLFPDKIIDDLGLRLRLKSRKVGSWTPGSAGGIERELLVRNGDDGCNRDAFVELTGDESDYRGFLELARMQAQIAAVAWPSLTEPLLPRDEMRRRMGSDGEQAWQALVEEPLGEAVERLLSDDLVRGMVFTDAKIGVSTYPHDPSLLQNRCFLYHVIGRGTGEWQVPVGGMGTLVEELLRVASATGKVQLETGAQVDRIHPGKQGATLEFESAAGRGEVDARFVLCNASAQALAAMLGRETSLPPSLEGSGFKVNMLLQRLPRLRSERTSAAEAFAGTVHIDEGYEQMLASYRESMGGQIPTTPPGEIYCHTLTDDSILAPELNRKGFHTLTLFGLDMPHRLFTANQRGTREEVLARYIAGLNGYLAEPIEDCLARDARGEPCIEAMSAVDLEERIHLPKGNIFHGDLSWPFAESEEEIGSWGVETDHPGILLCGSAARRGGAVSGIPGHNAAMAVLQSMRRPG